MVLKDYNQLKVLSDPFRSQLVIRLMEKPLTGQQLSEIFNLSRSRIHYHLVELEKNKLIKVVKKEVKNGIIQKFYQATARGYVPDLNLLPHQEEIGRTFKHSVLSMLERSRDRVIEAPEESFRSNVSSKDPSQWNFQSSSWEITATEESFRWFLENYFELMERFRDKSKNDENDSNSRIYYISNLAFAIEKSLFEEEAN